jgi:hypothetical protein
VGFFSNRGSTRSENPADWKWELGSSPIAVDKQLGRNSAAGLKFRGSGPLESGLKQAFAQYIGGRSLANDKFSRVPAPTRGDRNCEGSQQRPGVVLGDPSGRFVLQRAAPTRSAEASQRIVSESDCGSSSASENWNGSESAEMAVSVAWRGRRKPLRDQAFDNLRASPVGSKSIRKSCHYCHFWRFFRGIVDRGARHAFNTLSALSEAS